MKSFIILSFELPIFGILQFIVVAPY